jgi:biotin transport system substrate-specific component
MVRGTVVLYALGTAWFMLQTQRTLVESMSLCVIPFLPGDAAKIAVATLIGIPLRNTMDKVLHKAKQA